ncbi:hypothetical protein KUCAC02_022216, partial [Chaenocephalus aceratus]
AGATRRQLRERGSDIQPPIPLTLTHTRTSSLSPRTAALSTYQELQEHRGNCVHPPRDTSAHRGDGEQRE